MLCERLARVHAFYDSIGGLAGYQLKCLEMLATSAAAAEPENGDPQLHNGITSGAQGQVGAAGSQIKPDPDTRFLMPRGLDIGGPANRAAATAAAAAGLEALPHMAEILPLGGALYLNIKDNVI